MRLPALLIVLALALPAAAGCIGGLGGGDGEPYRPPTGARSATHLPTAEPWSGPNVTLAGRVLDARDGAPLLNATVTASLIARSRSAECGGTVVPWQGWALRPDAGGRFHREVPEPSSSDAAFVFSAKAPGFVTETRELPASEVEALSNATFRLSPAGVLRFHAPSGALVVWVPAGDPLARPEWLTVQSGTPIVSARADAYAVAFVSRGAAPQSIAVDVPPFLERAAAAREFEEDAGAPTVSGNVTGDAAAGALVLARDAESGDALGAAFADGAGRYNVTLARAAPVIVAAWVGSGASAPVAADASGGAASADLALAAPECPE